MTWYDGTVRRYSAKDGSILSETQIEEPSKDLFETFETENYIFESTLHGAPEVYTKKGHKLVKTLDDAVSRTRNYAAPVNMQRFENNITGCREKGSGNLSVRQVYTCAIRKT